MGSGALEGGAQFLDTEGFGDEIVHARFEAVGALFVHGAGGQGDDPRAMIRVGRLGAKLAGRLVSVDVRHLAIHEDDVVAKGLGLGEGFGSVMGKIRLEAEPFEDVTGEEAVGGFVLGDEDRLDVAE